MNQIDLEGRCAVVTGAAQGIGLAISTRLLESGASVALWDLDGELLEQTAESLRRRGLVEPVQVDVTDASAVEAAAASSISTLGAVDILVSNAGIAGPSARSWEYPLDQWHRVGVFYCCRALLPQMLDVDLNGVFYCCRALLPQMLERDYGRIVNVASIAGKEGNPNATPYSAAKAGVIALTKSIAKETADRNIAVNCITPAAARTRILEKFSQEQIDYMLGKIPRGRFVKVEEVAAMVAWIVSEENSFTTGAVFDLSGGRATY